MRLSGPDVLRAAAVVFVSILLTASPWARANARTSAAEVLYRQGILPSGGPVSGERVDQVSVEGADAACVNCHRRSGLGGKEGSIVIPPIIGKYLFRVAQENVRDLTLPHVMDFAPRHGPFTEVTLARAIRDGVDPDGQPLDDLMPRFKLDDASMGLLTAYLKNLSSGPMRGVERETLHFATIITPDTDPARRRRMLEVLQQVFADQNRDRHFYFDSKDQGEPPKVSGSEWMYNTQRKWTLHVWDLSGPPDTWQRQLRRRIALDPVFAVISGLGGSTWRPVHRFCQEQALPCLFPNVEVPEVAEQDFYPLYYSKGVFLEAQLLARRIVSERDHGGVGRVIQIYRQGDTGEPAARALHAALALSGIESSERPIPSSAGSGRMSVSFHGTAAGDVIVFWLRAADLAALPEPPRKFALMLFSGLMGGLENSPLPPAWRKIAHLSYPFDLPDLRARRMQLPLQWFSAHGIEVVDERIQSDTYLACVILARTLDRMLDSFIPDYLIERIEDSLGNRTSNGYYPRLGLARSQRFASKGGYIAHFVQSGGAAVEADGDWSAP